MKKCPICKSKTIPYKWIFFNTSKEASKHCIKCNNCKKNIRKSKSILIDMIFYNEFVYLALLIISMIFLNKLFQNLYLTIIGTLLFLISYLMIIANLLPLYEATESECRGDMTKLGAVLALIGLNEKNGCVI